MSYYPFGLTYNSYSRENTTPQDYKYNGKEEQDELGLGWLDYGARMYMADVGRWGGVDALADLYHSITPFAYVANSPLVLFDPDGNQISFSAQYNKKGELIGVTLTVTGKVINNSSSKFGDKAMQRQTNRIVSGLENIKIESSSGISLNVKADLSVADSESDINGSDHVFRIVDGIESVPGADKAEPGSQADGYAPLGQSVIYLRKGFSGNTAAHEFGHSAGLKHVDETTRADLDPTGRDWLRYLAGTNISGCECAQQQLIEMYSTRYKANDFPKNLMQRGIVKNASGELTNNPNRGDFVTRSQVESIMYKIRSNIGINGLRQK